MPDVRAFGALAACTLMACDGGPFPETRVLVEDSAGVPIVVNRAPEWSEVEWSAGVRPLLEIGDEGDPALQFDRVAAVRRLSDGRLVVVNIGTSELRVFGSDGSHMASFGGAGEGPGEFRFPLTLAVLPGDTLLVYDLALRRFTWLSVDGEVQRTAEMNEAFRPVLVRGQLLGDGRLLAVGGVSRGIDATPGLQATPYTVYLYDPGTGAADTIGVFPGAATHVEVEGRSVSVVQPLLAPDTWFDAQGRRIAVGIAERAEVRFVDANGRVERIVRLERDDREVTEGIRRAAMEARLSRLRDANHRRRTRRVLEEIGPPTHMPAFDRLIMDETGHVWLRRYTLPDQSETLWDIVSTEGHWLGGIELPASFFPHVIGADRIVGVGADALGVERVFVYALDRGAGSRRRQSDEE